MSRIDYSKWDKLDCSSSGSNSDDDDNGDEGHDPNHRSCGTRGAPRVTRLEYPSGVTLGPSQVQLTKAPPKASVSPFNPSAPPAQQNTSEGSKTDASQTEASGRSPLLNGQPPHAPLPAASIDATDDDEDLLYECLARNGGREGTQHWWSQTEDSAVVSFLIPWETTAKMVTDFNLREVKDEASGQYRAQLDVTIQTAASHSGTAVQSNEEDPVATSAAMHLSRQFRYPVKLAEELVEGCWQLHRMPHRHVRLLVIEVFKEPIGHGMTLWWDRCFVSDTASVVDTQTIPDRVQRIAAAGPDAQEKAKQFRKVWDEAHDEFRRRVKARKARQS
ncbi:hypothetical protein ABB37_00465 [Leptomonas pyrrhocoris]|uniref:Uncharacterized protein n=1 Tax=Leptomonas pyrrhocoris TaxID=157538 RepID=A0A0M9GAD0_LEPPY|nr:hypothetical protein ABB37_00465 [Leptomonas pyrrhocoris]KPA86230.1 hypothetical protein ABB37_00465 [Leptomonas pyrrhocoris]|eukprot:XP_015664669.1 hypothetical protein ABB37_00465 [Leptomonas pyrrhocoris]